MKNLLKKISLCLICMIFVIGSTCILSACGSDPETKDEMQILNLSVNPGIEFLVDKDDKVVSVTASNEDGAYILDNFKSFAGMSANEAALKFLELSEEYGFVVDGSADGESFTISVSGEGAEKLYNDVKSKIQSKANSLGLEIENMVEISKTELKDMVAQCYQEYSQSSLNDMSEENLLEMLKQSRIETKDMHTEDERFDYYKNRAKTIIDTKIEQIVEHFNANVPESVKPLLQGYIDLIDNDVKAYLNKQFNLINLRLSEEYKNAQTKLNNYINTKRKYLEKVQEYREALEQNSDSDATNDVENIEELKQQFEALKSQASVTYSELQQERDAIKTEVMNFVKDQFASKIELINNTIDSIGEQINLNLSEMENQINLKLTELKNAYVANSENPWNN